MTPRTTDAAVRRPLALLWKGYQEDIPVHRATQNRVHADGTITLGRSGFETVFLAGLARHSRPNGRFALLTPEGIERARELFERGEVS